MLMPPWHWLFFWAGTGFVLKSPVLQEALMSALYIHLLLETCGPLKAALRRSLWTTGQKQGRGFARSFVFEEILFCRRSNAAKS